MFFEETGFMRGKSAHLPPMFPGTIHGMVAECGLSFVG